MCKAAWIDGPFIRRHQRYRDGILLYQGVAKWRIQEDKVWHNTIGELAAHKLETDYPVIIWFVVSDLHFVIQPLITVVLLLLSLNYLRLEDTQTHTNWHWQDSTTNKLDSWQAFYTCLVEQLTEWMDATAWDRVMVSRQKGSEVLSWQSLNQQLGRFHFWTYFLRNLINIRPSIWLSV